jgi:hypothetical protein
MGSPCGNIIMPLTEDINVKAHDLITLDPDSPLSESVDPGIRAAAAAARAWVFGPDVVGTGVAPKRRNGIPSADEPALIVYVRDKRLKGEIRDELLIPPIVTMPGIDGPITTDVVAVGELSLQALNMRIRPLTPGYSIALLGRAAGTLACIVAKKDNPSKPLLLSNSHVFADTGLAALGSLITQPSKDDGGGTPTMPSLLC